MTDRKGRIPPPITSVFLGGQRIFSLKKVLKLKIQFMMGLKNYCLLSTGNRWYQLHTTIQNGFYSGATMEDIGTPRIIAQGENVAFFLLHLTKIGRGGSRGLLLLLCTSTPFDSWPKTDPKITPLLSNKFSLSSFFYNSFCRENWLLLLQGISLWYGFVSQGLADTKRAFSSENGTQRVNWKYRGFFME